MNNLRLFNGRGRTVRQLDALHEVGNLALAIATERYGSGFPDHNGGKIRKLGFNNARHNQEVGDNAARLCKYLGFSELEQELARTAGYAHDIRQLTGRGNDEAESAAWVIERLRETGVIEPEMAELAGLAISVTLPLFKSGQMIGQTANHLDDVSGAKELFVKTVASADLSELYTPAGPYALWPANGLRGR